MTFASGPYGQGFPEQPGFSQQPSFQVQPPIYSHQPGFGQQPGYPQPGWPQQPGSPGGAQPAPPRSPSGATAITAGILALLFGLVGLGLTAIPTSELVTGNADDMALVWLLIGLAYSLTLCTGAILLFRRKMLGRWLVVGACTPSIVIFLVAVGAFVVHDRQTPNPDLGPVIGGAILVAIPTVNLVLALATPTARWIRAKPNPVAAQNYPSYPH
ncbi:hypothetical protein [Mycobacterium sp. NPDC050441]|uniref:hypothetical protein n=1 Tax=Mycobacterium sp. NPDC050441 TaxID=3155403 RepID=UPI0034107404